MRNYYGLEKGITCLLFLCLSGGAIFSQSSKELMLTDSHDGESLSVLLQHLSEEKQLRTIFPSEWIDSLEVVQAQVPSSVGEVLDASLAGTKLTFWEDELGRLILIPKTQLLSSWQTESISPRFSEKEATELVPNAPREEVVVREKKKRLAIGKPEEAIAGEQNVSGYVRDVATGEVLVGATISISVLGRGTQTDAFGFYQLSLPAGEHDLLYRAFDREPEEVAIRLFSKGELDVELSPQIRRMDEVVIEAARADNVSGSQMGVTQINIQRMKQLPAFMGEVDVVRSALLLPGVQSMGEGASGFQVRGGNVGQNLVLLNQAPVFNTSHLFGFFSAFHPDLVSNFELYKGSIPARFGGRIASVLDIQLRDGNKKKWEARGGISPVTARFAIEGPIQRNKSSFLIGGRTTYSNWILRRLPDPSLRNSQAAFSDLSAKMSFSLNDKNSLNATGYFSRDFFGFNQDTTFTYLNWNATLNWQHIFSQQLYSLTSLIVSNYAYEVGSDAPQSAFQLRYGIRYQEGKTEFHYEPNRQHHFRAGLSVIGYQVEPGTLTPTGPVSGVNREQLEQEQAVEAGLYISDEWEVNTRLRLYAGLRFSAFGLLGPNLLYDYAPGVPRNASSRIDSLALGAGSLVQSYAGPEIRLSARYQLTDQSSLKLGYHRMRQYLHMMSNTTAISPFDSWKLSDPFLAPEIGDQVSLGYYRNFRQNSIETSVEVYAKNIQNQPEFKDGAQLVMNPFIETVLLNGLGRAYGVEVLIRKDQGRLNGWLSYTYARSFIRVQGEFSEETINKGVFFPANVDKPHDLSVVANYRFSRRLSFSTNFNYSTGRPITYPVGQYQIGDITLLDYSDRNQFRIPDFIRLDASVNLEGNHKIKKLAHSSWSFAVVNLLARRNAYSIFFVSEATGVQGYRLSIFGRPIATLTYNFRI